MTNNINKMLDTNISLLNQAIIDLEKFAVIVVYSKVRLTEHMIMTRLESTNSAESLKVSRAYKELNTLYTDTEVLRYIKGFCELAGVVQLLQDIKPNDRLFFKHSTNEVEKLRSVTKQELKRIITGVIENLEAIKEGD